MGKRKRFFTLIELFLSIGLIALLGSVVMLRTKPMLDHYRMNRSYEKLKREITFSKYLAQTAAADVEFEIEQRGENLVCTRKTDEPLHLGKTINASFIIPYLRLEKSKKETILITSNGWVNSDAHIGIYLGKERKDIDVRTLPN